MARYLLTCGCGKELPVDAGQAGGQIVCSCGACLDVPTLRNLRHLPQEVVAPSQQSTKWSARKGLAAVFLIGAALLAAVSLGNWITEPSLPEFDPVLQAKLVDEQLLQISPVEAWKTWIVAYRPLAERGFTPMESSKAPAIRAAVIHKRFLEFSFLSLAGVCLLVAALAAMWPTATPKRRR
jgi:hypothetical protein